MLASDDGSTSKVGIVLGIALLIDVSKILCNELGCDDGIVCGIMLATVVGNELYI